MNVDKKSALFLNKTFYGECFYHTKNVSAFKCNGILFKYSTAFKKTSAPCAHWILSGQDE